VNVTLVRAFLLEPLRRLWHLAIAADTAFVARQFVLSRLVYLAGGVMTMGVLDGTGKQALTFGAVLARAPDTIHGLLLNADSGWYENIVKFGYLQMPFSAAQQENWAFFPLFPALVRLAGGTTAAGILIANLAALAACLLLSFEVRRSYGLVSARWTVLLLLFTPLSGVLSSYRPESLVLFFSVLAWVAARHDRWWLAWAAVALAALARPSGVVAGLLVLGPLLATIRESGWAPKAAGRLAGVVLPIAAFAGFSIYLGMRTGNPLAWQAIQAAWGRTTLDPLSLLQRYWSDPLFIRVGWDFAALNWAILVIGCAAAVGLFARRFWSLSTFTLVSLLLSPLTGGVTQGLGRYATGVFPIFMEISSDRRVRRWRLLVLIVSAVLLALVGAWTVLGATAVLG
jgi:hypothetical protein